MQPPSTTGLSSWCGNLHQVQHFATQGVQWLFGCLPCVKGHHRVHPTNFEIPGSSYIVLEAKRRLRVLHLIPDPSNPTTSAKGDISDQVDAGDRCSLDSSGEDYWFMRWNRPIRPNLQRNSCNCSFRKSQIKSLSELKDSKPVEYSNGSTVVPVLEEEITLHEPTYKTSDENSLHNLAEKLSHNIVVEAVQKSIAIETGLKNASHENTSIPENVGDYLSKCCDNISTCDVNLSIRESGSEYGGYVNPVFLASNDALDLIPHNGTPIDTCDTRFGKSNSDSMGQNPFIKEHQDYNANEQNHHIIDNRNAHNKESINLMKHKVTSLKEDSGDRKKHRKSCLASAKAYLKKPVLLLIHGAGSSCEVWRNLMSRLVGCGYECVAPDLLGHGLSSAPDNSSCYKFHAFLQDLLSIFDRFVTEGRTAVVLGHGYGCSLAAAIARYRPEQVVQLVLISGGGPTPLAPRTPPSVSPCLKACLEPLLMCGFKRDVVYSVCGKQMVPISPETSGVPRHIVEHIAQGHVWPEGDAAFHRRIVAPTLLVHGMKDQYITLVQQCEMERTIPRSFLEVIPEAGHWAMLETPSHLSHMIMCFIDWWAPPNRTQ